MPKFKTDDLDLLLPSFAERAREVVASMKARGFKPVVFDTLRTSKESASNATKGTGIKDSMHEYGAACDVICGDHGWDCTKKKCRFYVALRLEIHKAGLFIGPKHDYPHFQAIPIAKQRAMRALGKGEDSKEVRDALVKKGLNR